MSSRKVRIQFESLPILLNCFVELSLVGENISIGAVYDQRHWIQFESATNLRERFIVPSQSAKMLSEPLVRRCVVRIELDSATILSLRSDKVVIVILSDLTKRRMSFREVVVGQVPSAPLP